GESSGEVARADEQPVDAVHLRDRLQLGHRASRFELYEHAHLAMGLGVVVLDAAVAVGADVGVDAAPALRRIAGARPRAPRPPRALYVGHEQRLHAEVEDPLDEDEI